MRNAHSLASEGLIVSMLLAPNLSSFNKRNECIALFKQLEEVATEKDKEYIQNSIKFVQEQLEK